jgi:hypothetical protein
MAGMNEFHAAAARDNAKVVCFQTNSAYAEIDGDSVVPFRCEQS